jgi:hypothetical protein
MKKVSIVVSILLFATVYSHAVDLQLRVIGPQANVRLEPNVQSQILREMPLGSILKAIKKEGAWYFVELAGENNVKITGYIHQSTVKVIEETEVEKKAKEVEAEKIEKAKIEDKPEAALPVRREAPVIKKETEQVRPATRSRRDRETPQRFFAPKFGLGFAFPFGDLGELFNLGLGLNFSGMYYFLSKGGYVNVKMTRLIISGGLRYIKKIGSIGLFAEAGPGLHFDILDIETWWWYATDTEINIGARVGGGLTFGKFEILAMYHMVKNNMFSIMFSYGF